MKFENIEIDETRFELRRDGAPVQIEPKVFELIPLLAANPNPLTTKDELIDYSIRSGAPLEVVENLQELEDDGQPYENIEEIWPDYPTKEDFFFNEDEY